MAKHNRDESYTEIRNDNSPCVSPVEKPKKFALLAYDGEGADGKCFITTHATLNECLAHVMEDESDFAPSCVVDLDTGKQWNVEFVPELEEVDGDYFAPSEEEEETEEETE